MSNIIQKNNKLYRIILFKIAIVVMLSLSLLIINVQADTVKITSKIGDYIVSVTGNLPIGAELKVTELTDVKAQQLLMDTQYENIKDIIYFALDIKIVVDNIEYQPSDFGKKVLVSIEAPNINREDSIALFHVEDDKSITQVLPKKVLDNAVDFETERFSVYIGTIGYGTNITLTAGDGYAFYSDVNCNNMISSTSYLTNATGNTIIYAKANSNYVIDKVIIKNEDGTSSGIVPTKNSDVWTLTFPDTLTQNQRITIQTHVVALGGTITINSTEIEVAKIFDNTVTVSANTNNVEVIKTGSVFNVAVKNNILLQEKIILGEGVELNVVSVGNNEIKRNFGFNVNNSYMFHLPNVNSKLSLGSGTITNDNITYYFNDGTDVTYPVGGTIPVSNDTKYVIYTQVNADITNTMNGTLTIDGGAVYEREYTGTYYSFVSSSNSTGNMIKVENGGTVNIWEGVTLQNNKTFGRDTAGGSAINLLNGELYMYGGIISRCVCTTTRGIIESSDSDGGAMMICGINTKAYIYDCNIINCESDNSGAISLWTSSTLYFLGGTIHQNFAVGDTQYPAQTMSIYSNSKLYMYGGTISDNQGINSLADIRVSSAGVNVLHLFDGVIGSVGSNTTTNDINLYSGQVSNLMGMTENDVNYYGGNSYIVTLPNAVNADGSQSVNVNILRTDVNPNVVYKNIDTVGSGTSTNLNSTFSTLLKAGTYTITITSNSMQKIYEVTVTNAPIQASAVNRIVTEPVVISQTPNSVNLKHVGTNNDATDGTISFGISTTNNLSNVTWYTKGINVNNVVTWENGKPTFINLTGNKYYFFVRANAVGNLQASTSESIEVIPINGVTISIEGNNEMIAGNYYVYTATIDPLEYPIENIEWSASGFTSPDSYLVDNMDGTATIYLALDETESVITLNAKVLNEDGDIIANDEMIVYTYVPTISATLPISATAVVDTNGEFVFPDGNVNKIENNSSVDIYLTEVTFQWLGTSNGNGTGVYLIFTNPNNLLPSVKIGNMTVAQTIIPNVVWNPTSTQGKINKKVGQVPGTLALNWDIEMGANCHVKNVPTSEVSIAKITYTVSYVPQQ